jgi:hypothetical protein
LLIHAAVFDATGRELTGAQTEVRRTLSAELQQKTQNGELRDTLELAAPIAARTLMIGLTDLTRNRLGTLEVPLRIPKAAH